MVMSIYLSLLRDKIPRTIYNILSSAVRLSVALSNEKIISPFYYYRLFSAPICHSRSSMIVFLAFYFSRRLSIVFVATWWSFVTTSSSPSPPPPVHGPLVFITSHRVQGWPFFFLLTTNETSVKRNFFQDLVFVDRPAQCNPHPSFFSYPLWLLHCKANDLSLHTISENTRNVPVNVFRLHEFT